VNGATESTDGTTERPADLADVQGAWRRDVRWFGDGPAEEVSDVLWLQVGRHFCDLRTALPGRKVTETLDLPQAFAGVVEVSAGAISFQHDLDSVARDPAHPDASTVHRVGEVMYERGPGFEERWVLASLPGDPVAGAEFWSGGSVLARIVRVGGVALAVWGGRIPGGAQYSDSHGWEPERASYRERAAALDTDAAVAALVGRGAFPSGWVALDAIGA
jgi:hypothetical protein